jgi:hypothetical protein
MTCRGSPLAVAARDGMLGVVGGRVDVLVDRQTCRCRRWPSPGLGSETSDSASDYDPSFRHIPATASDACAVKLYPWPVVPVAPSLRPAVGVFLVRLAVRGRGDGGVGRVRLGFGVARLVRCSARRWFCATGFNPPPGSSSRRWRRSWSPRSPPEALKVCIAAWLASQQTGSHECSYDDATWRPLGGCWWPGGYRHRRPAGTKPVAARCAMEGECESVEQPPASYPPRD